MRALSVFALGLLCLQSSIFSQLAPPLPGPDERYKADILVVVAHPDDETEITGYLARAIYEEHKRVAVVFGTPEMAAGMRLAWRRPRHWPTSVRLKHARRWRRSG